jgi:hypothetical protein
MYVDVECANYFTTTGISVRVNNEKRRIAELRREEK